MRAHVPAVCNRAGIIDTEEVDKFKARFSGMLRSSALEAAVRELESKAGGLFLYASLLACHLETMGRKIRFTELQGLPSGLSEFYEANFGRIVRSREQWEKYSELIAMIVAAREPLPVALAREVQSLSLSFFALRLHSSLSSLLFSLLFSSLSLSLLSLSLLVFTQKSQETANAA